MPTSPVPLSKITIEFGRRVRERRNELGLSQEALAAASGIHWTFVGQVERGRRNLTLHNIVKIASGLQVDPGVLVQGMESSDVE
jgi:transcriptional regulator with XRE-family HTH domain